MSFLELTLETKEFYEGMEKKKELSLHFRLLLHHLAQQRCFALCLKSLLPLTAWKQPLLQCNPKQFVSDIYSKAGKLVPHI